MRVQRVITAALLALGLLALAACSAPMQNSVPEASAPETQVTGFMGITGTVKYHQDFPSRYVIPRNIEVWLPPSYHSEAATSYPVLYMHDGQNIFDPLQSQYSQTDWGVDEAMTRLIEQGVVREAIIVGAWSTDKRFAEYMPQKAVTDDNLTAYQKSYDGFDHGALESDNYLKFLTGELKPFIDQTYRTLPRRDDTFIMGSSMGGLISAYAVTEYPGIFGGAACVSTHFPLGEGAIIEYLADKLPDPKTHKLYFDYGTETLDHNYEGYQNRMDAYIRAAGYVHGENWVTKKFEGHEHSERAWRARVDVPLTFLLGQ